MFIYIHVIWLTVHNLQLEIAEPIDNIKKKIQQKKALEIKMKTRYKAILALCSVVGIVVLADDSTQPKVQDGYPVGDPRRCTAQGGKDLLRLEVIPGGGWDNLRNKDAGMLMKLNYSKCRTTLDRRYLVPDDVYTIPEKSSKVDTYAELFTHWNNYSSTLSRTVNAHAGLKFSRFGISGKYSREYEKVKSRQFFDKAATTRVQVRLSFLILTVFKSCYFKHTDKTRFGMFTFVAVCGIC